MHRDLPPGRHARLAVILAELVELLSTDQLDRAWRTTAAEAAARGFPSTRAFTEWCHRAGVPVHELGGVALVIVADVDRVGLSAPVRPVPASLRREESIDAEIDRMLRDRQARAARRSRT